MPKLVVALPGEPPRVMPLQGSAVTLGREPENDIQLDLPDVSRKHSRIEGLPHGGWRVLDLGSKNGTYLNGRAVQAMALEIDDRIRIGEATIVYCDDDADPVKAARAVDGPFPWSGPASATDTDEHALGPDTAGASSTDRGETWRLKRDRERTGPHTRRSSRTYLKERLLRLGLLSQNIATEQDLGRLVDTILDEVIDFTGFERGLLLLVDEDDARRLTCVRGRHLDHENLPDAEKRFSRGLVDEAVENRRITLRTGIADDTDLSARESVASMGLESALCIPLVVAAGRGAGGGGSDPVKEDRRRARRRDRVLGVIYLDSTARVPTLDDDDLRLIEAVAAQAAIALQNARLHHQATTDPLTGLANRGFIKQVFDDELKRCRESNEPLAVLMLDLDHFKRINDTYGHNTGDEVLRRVSGRIRRAIRRDDYAGRWGGEEFVVLLPGEGLDGAKIVAEKIGEAVRGRPISESEVKVTISIGIAVFPEQGESATLLVKHADQALYAAKAAGRDRALAFRPELDRANHRTDPIGGLFDGDPARMDRNLKVVFDTIDALRSQGPPKEILDRTLDNVVDLTRARRALLIIEGAGGVHTVVAGRGRGRRPYDGALDFSRSSVRTALAEGRALCVLDSTDDKEHRLTSSSVDKLGLASVLVVPLVVGDRPIGVLYADDSTAHGEFSQTDLSHLEVMASQLALSLAANPRLAALVSGRDAQEETRNLKDEVARLKAELERLKKG